MKKILKRIGLGFLAFLALLLLCIAGAWAFLQTSSGSERVRTLVLGILEPSFKGKLHVDSLTLDGTRIILKKVTLHDEAGVLIAEAAELRIRVALSQLFRANIVLYDGDIQSLRLRLVQAPNGLNIAQAFESKKPSPKTETDSAGTPLTIDIRTVHLEDVDAEFLMLGASEDRRYAVHNLSLDGGFKINLSSKAMALTAHGEGQITAPLQGPLRLDFGLTGDADTLAWNTQVHAPGIDADAGMQMPKKGPFAIEVRHVSASADSLRAFVPQYPLATGVSGSARLQPQGDASDLSAHLRLGTGEIHAQGRLDLEHSRIPKLSIQVNRLALAEMFPKSPAALIQATLDVEGLQGGESGWSGKVALNVPEAKFGAQSLGPIRARGALGTDNFELDELIAILPGIKLTGEGSSPLNAAPGNPNKAPHLNVKARLEAQDLKKLAKVLGAIQGGPPPPLAGKGRLDVAMTGLIRHPALSATGSFANLTAGPVQVQDFTTKLNIPDVTRPLETDGSFRAQTLKLGDRTFREFTTLLATRGRTVEARIGLHGLEDVSLRLVGDVARGGKAITLTALDLRWPEVEWKLAHPTEIEFAKDLHVGELTLESNAAGKITARANIQERAIDAQADIQALDLAKLPKSFTPKIALAGKLNAQAKITGAKSDPQIQGRVELNEGVVDQLKKIKLTADATYAQDRVKGTAAIEATGVKLHAQADVSPPALMRGRESPVAISLTVDEANFEPLLASLGAAKLGVTGKGSAELALSGSAAKPNLKGTLRTQSLRMDGRPGLNGMDATLTLSTVANGTVAANLDALISEGKLTAVVKTPWSPGELIRQPPTAQAFTSAPLDVAVQGQNLPVATLLNSADASFDGKLSLRAALAGSVNVPQGHLTVELKSAHLEKWEAFDGNLSVEVEDDGINARLSASQKGQLVARGKAALRVPSRQLKNVQAIASAPLDVSLEAGPLPLADLQRLWQPAARNQRRLGGFARANVKLDGTLKVPVVAVQVLLDAQAPLKAEAKTAGNALGSADVRVNYAQGKSTLAGKLTSATGGTLKLDGQLQYPFGLFSENAPQPLGQAPLTTTLVADKFDLAFLDGLVPGLRALAGTLEGNANLTGTVSSPKLKGRLGMKEGRVALPGFGDYRQIQFLVEGGTEDLRLVQLSARSGGGEITADASATQQKDRYVVGGHLVLQRFPIVFDDQLMATVTTRADLQGEASTKLVMLNPINISSATIELPDVRRKDLQDLSKPEDIRVVKDASDLQKPVISREEKAKAQAALAKKVAAGEITTAREYRLLIRAPRNLWVRSNDLNVEIGLSDGFRVTLADALALSGEIRVIRGRVEVIGRRFEVQRDSAVRFAGAPTQPLINLTAQHTNAAEGVVVTMTVRGQGTNIAINASSQPPLSEAEIYTLLATGKRQQQANGGSSTNFGQTAVSVVGALAATELQKTLNRLPINAQISLDAGSQGLSNSKVNAGVYLNDRFYLGYTRQFGADKNRGQNSNGLQLEYQLTPRWSVEAQYGDANAGGVDLMWNRDF